MRHGRYTSARRHIYRCTACNWGRGYDTAEEADLALATHSCSWRGANMPAGKSIIQVAWEQLDVQVDEIIALKNRLDTQPDEEGLTADNLLVAQARARGKAEILALLMPPHFTTADEVSMESSRRRAARLAGDDTYWTPGLNGTPGKTHQVLP